MTVTASGHDRVFLFLHQEENISLVALIAFDFAIDFDSLRIADPSYTAIMAHLLSPICDFFCRRFIMCALFTDDKDTLPSSPQYFCGNRKSEKKVVEIL